ncbi:hypothetical protein DL770_007327 [Monosporascus sp. CRB-9-2]|nr:hypothetical protein DL770_007327 [Monosporascus sp. CRB-9-2]
MTRAQSDRREGAPYELVYWYIIPGRGEHIRPMLGLAANQGDDLTRSMRLPLIAALDSFTNEMHNCHRPVAMTLYYEDQKEESIRRVKDWARIVSPSTSATSSEDSLGRPVTGSMAVRWHFTLD